MRTAMRGALKDLRLDRGRVAFDDMAVGAVGAVGFRLGIEGMAVADGYDAIMFARAVKTDTELRILDGPPVSTRLPSGARSRRGTGAPRGATPTGPTRAQ